jgi:glyoxylase-like metal-dependent hydrolase (beta-lactamase superfamily II)
MNKWVKRGLQVIGALVLVAAGLFGALYYSIAGGKSRIADGFTPAPDVRVVKDGFVAFGVVDVADKKVALIDAGMDPAGKAVLAELARRGLGTDAVVAIFVTHGHSDHLAAAHLFPRATIYALADDVALAEGREASHGPLTKMAGAKPTGLHVESLKDGTTTSIGTKAIRVYGVPGHTAGSAAYLVSGVLFLGDSGAMTTDGKLVGPPWAFTDDAVKSRASLVALGDTLRPEREKVVAIVPGHTGAGHIEDLLSFGR